MSRRSLLRHGPEAFEQHYRGLYGERWENLKSAFLGSKSYLGLGAKDPKAQPYFLDPGSALVAIALAAAPGQRVLDCCAAPGGKSLTLLRLIFPQNFATEELEEIRQLGRLIGIETQGAESHDPGLLVCNERSAARRRRLVENLRQQAGPDFFHGQVLVRGQDAARMGSPGMESYDRILADVPCSSEAHLVQDPRHLENWSASRVKSLSIQAGAIAAASFDALKPGGRMLYSTCALSPEENQEVVKKILKKRSGAYEVALSIRPDWMEALEHGYALLPDRGPGWGPLYFAILEKSVRKEDLG